MRQAPCFAFEVFGAEGPERVESWLDPLPAHIVALVTEL